MLLTVKERLLLLNALPPTSGSVVFMRMIREFRENLGFSDEDAAAVGLTVENGATTWTENGSTKEIEVGSAVLKYISDGLQVLDSAERVTEDLLPLFDRFMG